MGEYIDFSPDKPRWMRRFNELVQSEAFYGMDMRIAREFDGIKRERSDYKEAERIERLRRNRMALTDEQKLFWNRVASDIMEAQIITWRLATPEEKDYDRARRLVGFGIKEEQRILEAFQSGEDVWVQFYLPKPDSVNVYRPEYPLDVMSLGRLFYWLAGGDENLDYDQLRQNLDRLFEYDEVNGWERLKHSEEESVAIIQEFFVGKISLQPRRGS